MTLPVHGLAAETFAALAAGGGGAQAIAELSAARSSRNKLLAHALTHLSENAGAETAKVVADAYWTLAAVESSNPEAVSAVLDYPAVSSWLLRTAVSLHEGDTRTARPTWLSAVAAAAVVRSATTANIDLTATNGVISLPTLGMARVGSGRVRLVSSPDFAVLETGNGRVDIREGAGGWQHLPSLSAEHDGMRLVLSYDTWEEGLFGDLPVTPLIDVGEQWHETLSAGWRVLTSRRPVMAEEVASALRMLVPLRGDGVNQASGTPQDAFGCVAMSLPSDPMIAAVTLAHEVQHTKLSALHDLVSLVDGDVETTFRAPWRPDRRPALALLHGIYAHLTVADFWRDENASRFARWRTAVTDTATVLLHSGRLTSAGEIFVRRLLDRVTEWNV